MSISLFPEFHLKVLENEVRIAGKADFQGRWTLVNIWGSWCGWCRVEHDFLVTLAEDNISIMGVSYKDTPKNASRFLAQLGDPYVFSVIDRQGELTEGKLGIHVAPVTLLVDGEGYIRLKYPGILDRKVWETHFVPLIQQF